MTDEVIVIAPNWTVLTFDNYRKAKVMLMSKYFPLIIQNPQQLKEKYKLEELQYMVIKTLGLNRADNYACKLMDMRDADKLVQELWPMLVAHGRRTVHMSFNKNIPSGTGSNTISYFCDYEPGKDKALDLNYLRLPPQARALVDMFVAKIKPFGNEGVPEHVFIKCLNETKEALKTRQRPWIVFNYYRKQLIARGFLDIKKPRGRRKV